MADVADIARLDETAVPISDEELTALALAADPEQTVDEDAVPIDRYLASVGHGATAEHLPPWYMAPARARVHGRLGRAVVLGLVGSFVAIEAFGLCSTYGQFPLH